MQLRNWTVLLATFLLAAASPPGVAANDASDAKAAQKASAENPPAREPATRELIKVSAELNGDKDDPFTVLVDVNDAPDLKDWALKAANHAIEWYPKVREELATEGFSPPRELTIVFKEMEGVAHASGTTINVSAQFVRDHPNDLGMIVHEMTHVIQKYPRGEPGWLVEGIADYVRYYVVEPGTEQGKFDPNRSSYKSGYQPAAGLLNWLEAGRGPGVVSKLNGLLRDGKYTPEAFKEITGGDPDDLWERFKADHRARSEP